VIVDNKPGVGGLAGASAVARAKPDGSTLLLAPNTLVISPHVLPAGAGAGLDVLKDLVPIVTVATTPMLLVANPQAGIRNVEQLLAAGRKGELNYGTAGNGSPMHFAGAMLARASGLKLVHVPYRGVAPSVVATMGGEVPLLFVALGGVASQIKAGKLVPVAFVESRRSALLPDVPTLAEGGIQGVDVHAWYGLFAGAGTPAEAVARLNGEVNAVLKLPDVREKLEAAGIELAGGTPQALGAAVAADYQRYGRIARELQIRAD
jgi:tripartite-type tricarboxylate transporter receptor subunit TctC